MLTFIRNLKLNIKVSLLGAFSVLITVAALLILATWESGLYNRLAQSEVNDLISADLDHITRSVYHLVQTENEAVQQQVDYNLNVARHIFDNAGEVELSLEPVKWPIINQYTKEVQVVELPKMMVGGQWLEQNRDLNRPTLVIDEITNLVGETATIFQRINDEGDMLRVATNVESLESERAIGTYIPAINPDGEPNPVVATILDGQNYHGRAWVVNAWYITAYEPLHDKQGRLVGMLYVGIKQKSIEARIRPAILQTEIGKTGYVYILGGKGAERGHYIVSKNGLRDGEDLWYVQDNRGRYTIRDIINQAISLKSGELGTIRYPWKNIGETESHWKIARLAYYEPWDWVIGASAYEYELQTFHAVLSDGRIRMMSVMFVTGIIITLLVGLIGVLIARTIARPVHEMQAFVETIIDGDLNQTVDIDSRDEIGQLARAFNIMTTRLRETLEGLHKSERFLNDIIENIPNMIIVKDAEKLHYVRFNKAGEDLLGYDREVFLGKSDLDIYPKEKAEKQVAEERAIVTSRQLVDIREERILTTSQGERVLHTKKLPILDKTGLPQYLLSISEDITEYLQADEERKRLVTQLEHSQRLEAVGRLAGGVAHDFNNILTGIIGYSEMLMPSLSENHEDYEDLLEIHKAAKRAAALTSQLLAFSRKQIIHPKVVDINDLIKDLGGMLKPLIGEDISYTFRPGEEIGHVKVDPGQMEQVLVNLAVNARDAMPSGGKLVIETDRVIIGEENQEHNRDAVPGEYVRLLVRDTGCGMDDNTCEHLFEPFFTTKEKGSGTGLGLSTVYGILKQNQGFITVSSSIGQGSIFKAHFPAVYDEVEGADSSKTEAELSSGDETIMLVEDENIVRTLTSKVLQSHGYTVLSASDGESAMAICREHKDEIDLLLTDVVLPGMNGLALLGKIRDILPDLKVIFMSGYTENVVALRKVLERGNHFISKPFSTRVLLQSIRDVLDKPLEKR